ncbi:extensin [Streptomyces sp. NPDC002787]
MPTTPTPPTFAPVSTPVRPLAPTRALTSSLPSTTTPPAGARQAPQPAVPLRRPTPATGRSASPGTGPAVQRLTADKPTSRTAAPLTVAPATRPHAPQAPQAPQRPSPLPTRTVAQRQATDTTHTIATPKTPGAPHTPTPPLTTPPPAVTQAPPPAPALIQRAPETSLRPTAPTTTQRTAPAAPPPTSAADNDSPRAQFDPRSLTDFQLDELTHKLVGRITRLVRTELRLDRERIGKLRDPRH